MLQREDQACNWKPHLKMIHDEHATFETHLDHFVFVLFFFVTISLLDGNDGNG